MCVRRIFSTLNVCLPINKAHACKLIQLTCKSLLGRLLRVARPHLSHHLQRYKFRDNLGTNDCYESAGRGKPVS